MRYKPMIYRIADERWCFRWESGAYYFKTFIGAVGLMNLYIRAARGN